MHKILMCVAAPTILTCIFQVSLLLSVVYSPVQTMILTGNEALRAFMDRLTTSTNVSEYVDLPVTAVMGDTSSGKSSLLSSLSNIELPSNSNLTTRCPIMLAMKQSKDQKASVTVQWKSVSAKDAKPFAEQIVTADNWSDLPNIISQAQKHIIDQTKKEVASDIVHVKLSGPDCEDLTLIDLPGIVRSRGKGESESLSEDIKSLITQYLENKRCIILAVVPANVDFHNSQIMADAQKVDPETMRTIPVITKPDLIDEGAEDDVKELLLGKKTTEFKMGFHMVKGRGQKALDKNCSIDSGLKAEETFFNSKEPWRKVPDRSLFGTYELRRKLGELQMKIIRSTIPDIIKEMQENRNSSAKQMATMGSPNTTVADKRRFFYQVRTQFVEVVKLNLLGSSEETGSSKIDELASARFHTLCQSYKENLLKGRLANVSAITTQSAVIATTSGGENVRGTVIELSGDSHAYIDYEDRASVNRSDFVDFYQRSQAYKQRPSQVSKQNPNGTFDVFKPFPLDQIRRDPKWIQDLITKKRPDGLPVFVNSKVFKELVAKFITEDWCEHCTSLLEFQEKLMEEVVDSSLNSALNSARYPRMKERIKRRAKRLIRDEVEDAKIEIDKFIDRESTPYSQDHGLFENLSRLRLEPIKRQLMVALGVHGSFQDSPINKSSVNTIIESIFEQNQNKSVDEYMAEEMERILSAYGKVSLDRFIDVVPMICWDFMRKFPTKLDGLLVSVTDSELESKMEETVGYMQMYEKLREKIDELDHGLEIFDSLM